MSLHQKEYTEAFEFLELEVKGLGYEFKGELKRALRTIQKFPKAGIIEKGHIRRLILHKFPYKIVYSIEADYIYIIAVAHMHRIPNYWVDRKPGRLP